MSTNHGVNVSEVPTGVRPPVRISAGLPVFVGTAPINLGDLTAVNKPILCYGINEFVAKFGSYKTAAPWSQFTLLEAAKAVFAIYGVAPAVFINVLDPTNADHVANARGETHLIGADGTVELQTYGAPDVSTQGILKSTVVVKKSGTAKVLGTDYTLAFSATGALVLTVKAGGSLTAGDTIAVDFDYLDPSGVTAADIIGGYDSGAYTGLEVVEQVFPRLRMVPGFLVAPKWSQDPTVAARMKTIARSINGTFRAMACVDLSTDPGEIATYADAPAWKSDNGYTSEDQLVTWGNAKFGDDTYHLSTVASCVANVVDAARNGIPYASPSNNSVSASALVLDDGSEVFLTGPQANALNAQGIATLLNTANGWKLWGNRTGGYPSNTDPKDAFIPIRRMFNWMGNTIILTVQRDVDQPGNRRLIDGVIGTVQSWVNSLVAQGALVGDATIEFREDENNVTDMADGKYVFHVTATPPSPAEQLDFQVEYDPAALASLF